MLKVESAARHAGGGISEDQTFTGFCCTRGGERVAAIDKFLK